MVFPRRAISLLLAATVGSCGVLGAQESSPPAQRLIVGTKEAPPFAMKKGDGGWEGISIDLWQRIAEGLNIEYEFRELSLQELLDRTADHSIDAAVAALTITPDRENILDFTHPFHSTGLGIAVSATQETPWLAVIRKVFSLAFLKILAALTGLLLLVGFLVWWFERKKNQQHFSPNALEGIGSGFWWSAVTMTTVGYGDKAPVTVGGRLLALVWMFAAIIMISSFTAAIASALTVTQLDTPVQGPEDLPGVRVGTVAESTSAAYLRNNRVAFVSHDTVLEGLSALVSGKIEAFVYDAPLLKYLVSQHHQASLQVLPRTFLRQNYGFAFCEGSPLREPVNRILLEEIDKKSWQDTLYHYMGG